MGIHQGCPIPTYLFIIVVEILAISIRVNKTIKGIKVRSVEQKTSQLSDDTTLLDIFSIKHPLSSLQDIKIISGLIVNLDKLLVKGIGFMPDENYDIKWTTELISTLGIKQWSQWNN